jgi:lipoyl(octanoyl) transferase
MSSGSLFPALDVYHDVDSRSAALNMAIDEALLETATVPSVRFYEWDHPALSFGYFGKFEDVAKYQRDIVRRWTGGGIVFHGEDLTYSIVIPAGDPAFGESSMSIYETVHRAIGAALTNSGQPAELLDDSTLTPKSQPGLPAAGGAKGDQGSDRSTFEGQCFANPVRADVLLNGRKVAGAAQRRTRRGLLQQGSIQGIDFGNGVADFFARRLSEQRVPRQLDEAVVARAEQIAGQKYGTAAWLHRR